MKGNILDMFSETTAASAIPHIPIDIFNQPQFTAEPVQKGHIPARSTSILQQQLQQLESTTSSEHDQHVKDNILRCYKLKCEECGKLFPAPWALKRHMTVHTGQKDWLCEICEKHFTRKENLKMHIARYHLK